VAVTFAPLRAFWHQHEHPYREGEIISHRAILPRYQATRKFALLQWEATFVFAKDAIRQIKVPCCGSAPSFLLHRNGSEEESAWFGRQADGCTSGSLLSHALRGEQGAAASWRIGHAGPNYPAWFIGLCSNGSGQAGTGHSRASSGHIIPQKPAYQQDWNAASSSGRWQATGSVMMSVGQLTTLLEGCEWRAMARNLRPELAG
jgi:hypothetical protein